MGGGGGGSGLWGVRVDVNTMLGVGGDVGYGRCEPRIEGIVQCTKRYCTILRKLKQVAQRATIAHLRALGTGHSVSAASIDICFVYKQ